ncbi:MAG TPA: CAP domain-containing protein [Candidatus Paceibacterota bacterium]|nr:CAP domain-containing protein [Candidatus Paceibacterota bacterium]HMO82984.1 CAP domain-containing protein [Candidatus Paceibacterota bacterium]
MTRARVTFCVFSSLLIIGVTSLLAYSFGQNNKDQAAEATTEEVIAASEETIAVEEDMVEEIDEIQAEAPPTPAQPTTAPPPKPQEQVVKEKPAEPEDLKINFNASAMLAAHNAVRTGVGIAPLTYSPSLAQSAQDWSDKLQANNCDLKHDNNTPYGENLYWESRSGSIKPGLGATPAAVVNDWASEVAHYNYNQNNCVPGKVCGHYTQIVWAETTEVGCGVSQCRQGNTQSEVWVCRYNPPGNFIGEKPY